MRTLCICLSALICFSSCSSPGNEADSKPNQLLIASTLDQVEVALNDGKCDTALTAILPLFNSSSTTNDIRMAAASAYACKANVKVIDLVFGLMLSSSSFGTGGLWKFFVAYFPSSLTPTDDRKPQYAESAIDAALSVVDPNIPMSASDWITSTGYNPTSLISVKRMSEANSYLTFLSMALIGSLLSRGGNPDASYNKQNALPWLLPTQTKGDGCALASGLLFLYDGLSFLSQNSSGSIQSVYSGVLSTLTAGYDLACKAGCDFCAITDPSVSCTTCPQTLRNRDSCTGSASDVNSCAAAGLANFVNSSWI